MHGLLKRLRFSKKTQWFYKLLRSPNPYNNIEDSLLLYTKNMFLPQHNAFPRGTQFEQ